MRERDRFGRGRLSIWINNWIKIGYTVDVTKRCGIKDSFLWDDKKLNLSERGTVLWCDRMNIR